MTECYLSITDTEKRSILIINRDLNLKSLYIPEKVQSGQIKI